MSYGRVTKETVRGLVELRGNEDALAYAMQAIQGTEDLAAALEATVEWAQKNLPKRSNLHGSFPFYRARAALAKEGRVNQSDSGVEVLYPVGKG